MKRLSVIVCSHKAPPSLLECLRSILAQTEKSGVEVILVNNGFSPESESFLFKEVASWDAGFLFRICHERRPGLGYARVRGFEEATGEWCLLLDDDNTLEADFISQFYLLAESHPGLGGITSVVVPAWEQTPPSWLEGFGTLCLSYNYPCFPPEPFWETRFGPDLFAQAPRPPGGGMIVHGRVVDAYLAVAKDPLRLSLARTGDSLVGCEDQDLWNRIGSLGMDILQTTRLRLRHHIPVSRLKLTYLARLNFQMQYSYRVLQRLDSGVPRARPGIRSLLQMLAQSGKLLKLATRHPREHPWQKQVLQIACEWGRLAGDCAELEPDER
jgi:glycosyltransferase involved in cell wall biosynthesis